MFGREVTAYWQLIGPPNKVKTASTGKDILRSSTVRLTGRNECDRAVLTALDNAVTSALRQTHELHAIVEMDEQVDDHGLCTLEHEYPPHFEAVYSADRSPRSKPDDLLVHSDKEHDAARSINDHVN
ncbi:MAG: hypothetical protein ACYDA1_08665 [Vulcanimicrobiaceae bacterium]